MMGKNHAIRNINGNALIHMKLHQVSIKRLSTSEKENTGYSSAMAFVVNKPGVQTERI